MYQPNLTEKREKTEKSKSSNLTSLSINPAEFFCWDERARIHFEKGEEDGENVLVNAVQSQWNLFRSTN